MENYFAGMEKNGCALECKSKIDTYYNYLRQTGRTSLYHNVSDAYYTGRVDGGKVQSAGAKNELKKIRVNHFKAAIHKFDSIISSAKPVFKGRSANSDTSSVEQTRIVDDTFEHFQKKSELNEKITQARYNAERYGEGSHWHYWDKTSGNLYNTDPTTGAPVLEGDPCVEVLTPMDLVRDVTARGNNNKWVIVRQFANKHEYSSVIEDEESRNRVMAASGYKFDQDREVNPQMTRASFTGDTIVVWHFYHSPSMTVPNGRHLVFLDGGEVLSDTEWQGEIPVATLFYEKETGDFVSYTPAFDTLAPYQAFCSLDTTALSNCSQYGNPTYVSTGKVQVKQIKDRFTVVQKEPGTELMPLESPQTPVEVYNYAGMLKNNVYELWGISVAQTGSEETIKAMPGNALALMESTTIRFAAPFQQNYNRFLETTATMLMRNVIDNMPGERVLEVSGKDNRPYMPAITAEKLKGFQGFYLDVGNPALQTVQGNEQLAKDLAMAGMIKTAAEYSFVRETGRVDLFISPESEENILMMAENEQIRNGVNPIVLVTDNHALHIKTNRGPLMSPEARENPAIVEAGTAHLLEHIAQAQAIENTELVAALGTAPQPPAGTPAGPPTGAPADSVPQEAPIPDMPTNPVTGQEFDIQTGGGAIPPQQ